MEGIRFRIATVIQFGYPRCLKNLQATSASEPKVGLSRNLVGGIGETWRFRIAKIVPSDIQDGHHGGHLETLHTTSAPI